MHETLSPNSPYPQLMTHTSSSCEESGNAHVHSKRTESGSSESDEDEGCGEASSFRGGTYVQRGRRTSSARGTQKRRRSEGQQSKSIRCGLVDALKAESRLKEHASSQASLNSSLSNLSLCLIAPQCSSGGHSDAYKN